jgi:hypothetical protein
LSAFDAFTYAMANFAVISARDDIDSPLPMPGEGMKQSCPTPFWKVARGLHRVKPTTPRSRNQHWPRPNEAAPLMKDGAACSCGHSFAPSGCSGISDIALHFQPSTIESATACPAANGQPNRQSLNPAQSSPRAAHCG